MAKFYHLVPERGYVFPRDSDGTPTIEHQKQTKMTNPLFRAMLHYVRIPFCKTPSQLVHHRDDERITHT